MYDRTALRTEPESRMPTTYAPFVIYSEEGTPLASIDATADERPAEMEALERTMRPGDSDTGPLHAGAALVLR
jgi:hypothetical protein